MSQAQSRGTSLEIEDALTADERAELERLRRENTTLRAGAGRPRTRPTIRWRSLLAMMLIVVGCVLAPVSLAAVWTHNEVSDTDHFVATAGPLIDDPAVQEALTNRVTTSVFQYVDVQGLADQSIAALAAQGLPPRLVDRLKTFTPALATAVTGFVRDKVGRLIASPQFASAWNQAVTLAHQQLVTVLSGDSQSIVVQGGTVNLDLGPFIDAAKQRLAAEGLTAVNSIPAVHPTIALAPADQLVRAQSAYDALDSLATVLPWITLLVLAVGVYLARVRMRALVAAGLGVAGALVLLAAGLLVARGLLVGAVPAAGAPAAAASFDIIMGSLRASGRAVLVLALVVALGGFLAGSSASAINVRHGAKNILGRIRGGPSATGRVGIWARAHVRGLRIGAVALAALLFVFLPQPTGVAILLIAVGLLLVLAVIEFLARPGQAPAQESSPVVGDVTASQSLT